MASQSKKLVTISLAISMLLLSVLAIFSSLTGIPFGGNQQAHAADFTINDFSVPGAEPWGTTFDSSGHTWVAIPGCDPSPTCPAGTPPGKISVFDPQSKTFTKTYQLPANFGQALFLEFDKSGNLWFPMPMTNSIGMLNPNDASFQQWPVPTDGSGPWDIAIDSKGTVWFTEHYGNKIGAFHPDTQTFDEVSTPSTNSLPYGITVDSSDNIWFTENNSSVALIAQYTTSGTLNEYKIRNTTASALTPHLITVDHSGNLWWTEGFAGRIGKLVVSQATPGTNNGVTEFQYPAPCGNCGAHTSGIGVDSNNLIWFDDSLQSSFGSFPASGNGSFTMFNTPTTNSHPHDGLSVDSQDRIWFDEEFANKLALAVPVVPPTPTPTDTPTSTATSTPTPTPTSTPNPTTLGQDTFQRANQTRWGKASDGQSWGGDANTSSAFSIVSNTGKAKNTGGSLSAVLGPSASNEDVVLSGSITTFANCNFGPVARWTNGNNWYKAYIDGKNLIIQKKVNGTTTTLKTVAFAATANTAYKIHFQVTGTTLSASVWKASATEPANWMVTTTDSSLTAGRAGLRLQALSATFTITSFIAKSI